MTEPDRIWINDKWEAYLRPTFDGDTSGYIRVDLVDPAVTVGVKPPFYFDRYINGVRMAEDVCVERETTLESAMLVAARIASKGPNGEAPVLVYRAPVTHPAPDAAARQDAKEAETYAWKLEEELRDTQDRANAFATKEYYTEMRAERAEAKLAKAMEALLWCSGSADFNEGGVAREGWLKVCAPLLKGESHD